jgi:hypothetical protein
MNPKQRRIIERDIETLFSVRAFTVPSSVEAWMKLDFFHPTIKTDKGEFPLSPVGIAALHRLTTLISDIPEVRDSCSPVEIAQEAMECYSAWIRKLLQPTGREFTDNVVQALLAKVKTHKLLIAIEGVDLVDQDTVELGSMMICRADRKLLDSVRLGGILSPDWVFEQFKDKLWLTGTSRGSPKVALQRFEHRAILTVGLLAVCGALLYKGAIWRSRVRLASSTPRPRGYSILCWEPGGEDPHLISTNQSEQLLPLGTELIAYLRKECFLDQLIALLDQEQRTEIQDAIVRCLYWFGDAHGDRNPTMRFIKLWSCAECFFAIDKTDITEANARGIATTLIFAGYRILDPKDYPKFKRRLKSLYDLRSRAIHRAEFGLVENSDLEEFSQWVAWLVISMAALAERGFETLSAVNEQAVRLDAISIRIASED